MDCRVIHAYVEVITDGLSSNTCIRRGHYRWTVAQNKTKTYSSVLHSHTVLMKLCPCGRYRQL